jgi:hypothetical protein
MTACKYVTAYGQCMRIVLPHDKSTCCWQHMRYTKGLTLQPSKAVPGATGLFTNRSYMKDELIGYYDVSKRQLEQMQAGVNLSNCKKTHAQCEQFFQRMDKCYKNPYQDVAKGKASNARYEPSACCKHILLKAKRNIGAKKEILVEHSTPEYMEELARHPLGRKDRCT